MDFKTTYRRFRQWQLDPFEYEYSSQAPHRCNNCSNDYVGNFCPMCSQKQNVGPITWKSVVQSIAEVLLFFTYKQLFGYGVWGTIWRLAMSFVCGYTLWSVLLNFNYGLHLLKNHQNDVAMSYFLNVPIALLFMTFILTVCYFISKPRKRTKQ